jgi:hypothetical protein
MLRLYFHKKCGLALSCTDRKYIQWNCWTFKYLGTTRTNQSFLHEEIKRRLNSGNACSFGAERFAFQFAVKEPNTNIYRTIILFVVFWDVNLGLPCWGSDIVRGCMLRNNQQMHQFLPVYYFKWLLLHVSATVCHPQGARLYHLCYIPIWVFGWQNSVFYVVVCILCGGLVRDTHPAAT